MQKELHTSNLEKGYIVPDTIQNDSMYRFIDQINSRINQFVDLYYSGTKTAIDLGKDLIVIGKMIGQRLGYMRVNTFDRNFERQLEGYELNKIFIDKASGKDTDRPKLRELIEYVREGDMHFVHSMDRLARNLDDLRSIAKSFTYKGVCNLCEREAYL